MMCVIDEMRFHFEKLKNKELLDLLVQFESECDTYGDTFMSIKDFIWEDGTCYPDFYIVIPYLIYIASKRTFTISKELWGYLGSWIATQVKYRVGIDNVILDDFDFALSIAQSQCIKQIISVEKMDDEDAVYLYAALFAFANHRMGYMALSGYKDDIVGTSMAKCKNGHITDYSVYNTCIVLYEEEETCCKIMSANDLRFRGDNINMYNPWHEFSSRFDKIISSDIDDNIRSHFVLARQIVQNGVEESLDIKNAFSLYACLLISNGTVDVGRRVLHGLDEVTCSECGEIYTFADGWCEDTI